MKKFTLIFYLFSFLVYSSQDELIINDANYEKNNNYDFTLGRGVQFSFDDNKHVFGIGGMSQSRYLHLKPDGSISNPSNYFGIKSKAILCLSSCEINGIVR